MVEAKDVDGNEEKLEGPVLHDHFSPEVECEVPVICQEVWMRHCAPVNDTCKHSDLSVITELLRECFQIAPKFCRFYGGHEVCRFAQVGGEKAHGA